jgi:hypothetical protein
MTDDKLTTRQGTFIPWVECDSINRNKKQRPSPMWALGRRYSKQETPGEVKAWQCYQCRLLVQLHRGMPSNAQKHMEEKHQWRPESSTLPESERGSTRENTSGSLRLVIPQQQQSVIGLFQQQEPSGSLWRTNSFRWLIETGQPLSTVDHPAFQRMIIGITPKMNRYLYGRNAARQWAEDEFERAKERIKDLFKQAASKIHISMDIWTSKYSKFGIFGVNAHFIVRQQLEDDKTELKVYSILLALRRLTQRHTGEYEATVLADIIKEYDFVDNLGVCIADNAGDNNTAVVALFRTLHPELKDLSGKRVRCLAHVINLAAKAYLFNSDNKDTQEAFVEEVLLLEEDIEDEIVNLDSEVETAWRKQGALGKLHNVVKCIRSSSTRKEEFRSIRADDGVTDNGKFMNAWCINSWC